MKTFSLLFALILSLNLAVAARAETPAPSAQVGRPAPEFTLTGQDGKPVMLTDFRGRFVVLEWTNPICPFVHKFYDSGTMQKTQQQETTQGVVWLRINSSADGMPGAQTPAQVADYIKANHVAATNTLLDPTGQVGHLYGARTTPQMFVIDPNGKLIYAGGIDDKPSANAADIATAKNMVVAALKEASSGQAVTVATSRPYGCHVEYKE